MAREEFEFKFRVDGEEAMRTLVARVAGPDAPLPPAVRQVNHFFDTTDRVLGATNRVLRLREEAERFILTAKGPGSQKSDDALAVKAEEEVVIPPAAAREILAGTRSPLVLLDELLPAPRPDLVQVLLDLVGDAPLAEVGAFANARRRLGPIPLATTDGPVDVLFELDRTEFPGDVIHHEIEVEVAPAVAEACRGALLDLLDRAGIAWRSSSSKAKRFFDLLGGNATG